MNAQTLNQARQNLVLGAQQRQALADEVKEQKRKIADLEREVQTQAAAAEQARAALNDALCKIESLRAKIPDDAPRRAYEGLVECLTAPMPIEMRRAA